MYASWKGNTNKVKSLIANKAIVNAKNRDHLTALMYAVAFGHKDIVNVLIAAKANVNIKYKNEKMALILSSEEKRIVSISNNSYWTALMIATSRGYKEIVRALVAAKANVNIKHGSGWNAIMFAVDKDIRKL